MPEGFNQDDLFDFITRGKEIVSHTDKQLNEGKLVVHSGLILPKEYQLGSKHEVWVQPLNHEIEPGVWVTFNALIFKSFTEPEGELVDNFACQGLMYYAIKAFKYYYDRAIELQYEDQPDVAIHYANVFKTTALQYCVPPEQMYRYWPRVETVFKKMFGIDVPPFVKSASHTILHKYAE